MTVPQVVKTQFFTFAKSPEDRFVLESGDSLSPVTLAYETYGTLNDDRDNAILVFHALSGSQHAAGYNPDIEGVDELWTEENHRGWWDDFIGPGKALDTERYFVICINYVGGCYGSTGPKSIDPATGKPYGGNFPIVTAGDIVRSQVRLLDHFGIDRLLATMGGSLGGVLALELALRYPQRVRSVVPIAAGAYATTLHKLFNFEQIYAIEKDPNFNHGNYYDGPPPNNGLILARMIAHKNFVHLHVMEDRSRREIFQEENDLAGYRLQHQIESYMLHQGKKFVKRFDANTYLRIVNMWQHLDMPTQHGGGSLVEAVRRCRDQRFLIFSIDSDVCFWPEEQQELADALKEADVNYQYMTVHSDKGHDSFLLEPEIYTPMISFLLQEVYEKARV